MRRQILSLLLFCLFTIGLASMPRGTQAAAPNGYDLAAAVNAYRRASGLPELKVNGILMSIAQAQAEYNITNPGAGHTGPGGTRPIDRAYNAGYGGGATITYFSENWACGTNLSINDAIYSMWQDEAHLNTMLGANYKDIGAGVAEGDGRICMVVDVGAYSGQVSNSTPAPTLPGGTQPTPIEFHPIVTSTPNADGSIIHIVEANQFLVTIAEKYNIPLATLLQLNNLTATSVIYPGQKLIIRPAFTPTPTSEFSPTPTFLTPTLTPTRFTRTPTSTVVRNTRTPTATLTPTPEPPAIQLDNRTLGTVVLGISGLGVVAFILSFFIDRKKPK